jgi:hypothetical protein
MIFMVQPTQQRLGGLGNRARVAAWGWCPAGRRAEDGPIPATYQLVETPSDYALRVSTEVEKRVAALRARGVGMIRVFGGVRLFSNGHTPCSNFSMSSPLSWQVLHNVPRLASR